MKKLIWISIILLNTPNFAVYGQCTTAQILSRIRPGATWSMQGDSMRTLNWLDSKQKKPTVAEVEQARKTCIAEEIIREERKKQARLDVKNQNTPIEKKVDALILLLDMDK